MDHAMYFESYPPSVIDSRFQQGPWQHGKILNGAYREDNEDVVFNYKDFYSFWTGTIDNVLITATHFWVADPPLGGDTWTYETPCSTNQYFENAFIKARAMWEGYYWKDNNLIGAISIGPFTDGTYYYYLKIGFPTLPQAYNNHNSVVVTHYSYYPPHYNQWHGASGSLISYLQSHGGYPPQGTEEYIHKMCWEVVGRICHLLGDMSIPAHSHGSIHEEDRYETVYLSRNNHAESYNFNNAIAQAQLLNQEPIIKLDYVVDPIRYCMYITNQGGDRFAGNRFIRRIEIGGVWFCGGDMDVICGNTDYQSSGSFGWDDYGAILGPFYQSIGTPPCVSNPPIIYDPYCEEVANNSYVLSFRTTAGFLWYVYNKFILNTNYEKPPIFSCFSPNPQTIYGEIGTVTCVLSQGNPEPNLHTSFWWRAENFNPSNQNGIHFHNAQLYGSYWITDVPYLIVHWPSTAVTSKDYPPYLWCKAKNQYGETAENKVPNFGHSNSTGCPWLLVQNSDTVYHEDNNLLNRSKFQENIGFDITDKYVLGKSPGLLNDLYTFSIEETSNDTSFINNIKLYEVTHPMGTLLCVTEDNQLAIFDSASVISVNQAFLNEKEITEDVQFHIPQRGAAPLSDTLDHTFADFPLNTSGNSIIANLKFKSYENQTQKDWIGLININYNDDIYSTTFARRENKSITAIPLNIGTANINNVNIDWYKGNEIRYIAVANLDYSNFSVTELPLYEALSSYNNDELGNLLNIDSLYSVVTPSKSLLFKFYRYGTLVYSSNQDKKDYVIEVNGRIGSYLNYSKSNKLSKPILKKGNNIISYKNKLNNNYPNPFNPVTKISYSIEKQGLVKMKIYDILGREIKTLVNEIKNPGEYVVEFNGSAFASGVYFYRIECNGFTSIKKMVLIK